MEALADRHQRLWARLIDILAFAMPVAVSSFDPYEWSETTCFIGTVLVVLLQIYWLTTDGQTIGKRVFHIRIVDAKTRQNGGFMQNVLRREIFNLLLNILPIYWLVDYMWIFNMEMRCLHDLIAGTIVIKKPVANLPLKGN